MNGIMKTLLICICIGVIAFRLASCAESFGREVGYGVGEALTK